jgi:transposase InsO family protein
MLAYGLGPEPSPHQRHYKQHSGIREAPPNLLKIYGLFICRPNFIWACDFTYLWAPRLGRWYYLATVIDLYGRDIVGWSIGIHHDSELVLSALYDALAGQNQPEILHFDRGSEYLSDAHLDLLDSLGIKPSASAKASPWQNGRQERFYGSFKTELGSLKNITSEGELFELVAVTISYYNTKRIHSILKTNPMQYRQNYNRTKFIGEVSLTGVRDKVLQISGT